MRVIGALAALLSVCTLLALSQDRSFIESKIQEWQQEVARNPKDYETLTAIGAAYGKLGENATAIAYFNRAIAVNSSYADAYLGLGSAYGFVGKPAEALAALKKAVALDPKNPSSRLKLG